MSDVRELPGELPLAARLEVFRQRLTAIPERMGETLARTACSANIKERRDHSCALFDDRGRLLAQAAHIPVHLGSMAASVEAARRAIEMQPGDAVLLNDPYCGGTHLPDLTLITPVFDGDTLAGYAANRAHHADVGGAYAGSMGPGRSIHAEGLRVPPVRWLEAGRPNADLRGVLLANVRNARERLGDLEAQQAANEIGRMGLLELRRRYDARRFAELAAALLDYTQERIRLAIAALAPGAYSHEDALEGDGVCDAPLFIRATLTLAQRRAHVSFAGTSPAAAGCVNCPLAVTRAAVHYLFLCLAGTDVPANAGLEASIDVEAPRGCLVNAEYPAAVAGGNVETSQRIVDVLLGALASAAGDRMPAESAGTMSSVALGAAAGPAGVGFSYYETVAGGSAGSPDGPGESGIQTHMTNTRNTPIEALESAYPLRVIRYALARGTGGAGLHRGGDGVIREIKALAAVEGTLLADRHRRGPAGRNGGGDGRPGSAHIVGVDGRRRELPSKGAFHLSPGEVLCIQTPGGGGFGSAPSSLRSRL